MPCITGRSKHSLCKPSKCSTEEKCPCTQTDAFSCQRSCEPEKCVCDYLPREAFGRIIAQGQTGVSGIAGAAVDPAISNAGIESVTPLEEDGFTGALLQINFKRGLFNRCPDDLPPVVSVTPCRAQQDVGLGFNISLSTLECDQSTTESVVVAAGFQGEIDSPDFVVSLDFRAVQAPRKNCC